MPRTFEWVTPEGTVHALDRGEGVDVQRGLKGLFAPAVRLIEDQVPFQPGVRLRAVQDDARDVTFPVMFAADTEEIFYTTMATWCARMDPGRGNGKLRCTGPDNVTVELACVVTEGLDLDEAEGLIVDGWCKTALTIRAPWPYFQTDVDEFETWSASAPPQWFPWSYPISFGASDVFSSRVITVSGGAPTYPVWTIVGPGDSLVITNVTTGRQFGWTGVLGAHETLTIDTRPAELSTTPKRATRNDGSNEFGSISPTDFWPLEPGVQEVAIQFASTDVGSRVDMNYRPNLRSVASR